MAFALIGGDDLLDMQTTAVHAQIMYDSIAAFPDTSSIPDTTHSSGIAPIRNTHSQLLQNFPNPSNGNTTFAFTLSQASFVDLCIYDVTGKLVSKAVTGQYNAGYYAVEANLSELSSGIYTYVLKTNYGNITKKLTIIK